MLRQWGYIQNIHALSIRCAAAMPKSRKAVLNGIKMIVVPAIACKCRAHDADDHDTGVGFWCIGAVRGGDPCFTFPVPFGALVFSTQSRKAGGAIESAIGGADPAVQIGASV